MPSPDARSTAARLGQVRALSGVLVLIWLGLAMRNLGLGRPVTTAVQTMGAIAAATAWWLSGRASTRWHLHAIVHGLVGGCASVVLVNSLLNDGAASTPLLLGIAAPFVAYSLGERPAIAWSAIVLLGSICVLVVAHLGLVRPEFHQGPWEVVLGAYLPLNVALLVVGIASRRATDVQIAKANFSEAQVRKQAEALMLARDAALEGTRAKSAFLATMSHELRTPLNAIIGMASVIEAGQLRGDQRECLATIRSGGETLLSLIGDILDFSKIEAGKLEMALAPVELARCLDDALDLVSTAATAKGLRLAAEVADGVPRWFMTDRARLQQVLLNLLSNAVKFTASGAIALVVRARPLEGGGHEIEFRVTDDGIGIPIEKQRLLFEAFSQLDSSITREYGGTGLGLAISKALVALLGGRIWVESATGTGSTFAFTIRAPDALPQDPPVTHRVFESGGISAAPTPSRRVLVVEDNTVNQKVQRRLLEQLGHKVDVVSDGFEALLALRRAPYDAVFLDLQMPGLDGLETARRIVAEWPVPRRPRIIALTANVGREDREAALASGMDDYLSKPVRLLDLEAAMRGVSPNAGRSEPALPAKAAEAEAVDGRVISRWSEVEALGDERFLTSLIETFLGEAPKRVALLEEALSRGDARGVELHAHTLKGSANALGVVQLALVAATVEAAAKGGDLGSLASAPGRLRAEAARAEPVLRDLVAQRAAVPRVQGELA